MDGSRRIAYTMHISPENRASMKRINILETGIQKIENHRAYEPGMETR